MTRALPWGVGAVAGALVGAWVAREAGALVGAGLALVAASLWAAWGRPEEGVSGPGPAQGPAPPLRRAGPALGLSEVGAIALGQTLEAIASQGALDEAGWRPVLAALLAESPRSAAPAAPLADPLRTLRRESHPGARPRFLELAYTLARSCGDITPPQRLAIAQMALALGVSEEAHREVRRTFFAEPSRDHDFQTLGLSPEADDATLKRRYRDLVRRYHPDRAGEDPAAAGRLSEVREAYDRIRLDRGL